MPTKTDKQPKRMDVNKRSVKYFEDEGIGGRWTTHVFHYLVKNV